MKLANSAPDLVASMRRGTFGETGLVTVAGVNPKSEYRNPKQIRISKFEKPGADSMNDESPKYDLEERTFKFADRVRTFVKRLPRTISNYNDVKQLIRASGSVGANYIEANESLGKKDFLMHIKISRKEAKESRYWARLIDVGNVNEVEEERRAIVQESTELMNIFGAILRKSDGSG